METKIAVFSRSERDFREIRFEPKDMFVRIKNSDSLRGMRFSGFMLIYDFYEDRDVGDAYEFLRIRQPELFTKK